jgi:hypothetical protein
MSDDPIFVAPRFLPRSWGGAGAIEWCANAQRPSGAIGEIWALHPNNMTSAGKHLGELMMAAPQDMLGDVGRAPPTMRIVSTGAPAMIVCEPRLALWRILEAAPDALIGPEGGRAPRACCTGQHYRASDVSGLVLSDGVIALETRASFLPTNTVAQAPALLPMISAFPRRTRQEWLRDRAMSIEHWTLPAESWLEPDGETCHVVMPLTDGVTCDGHRMDKGEAMFLPACGRSVHLSGAGARIIVAYPDRSPTSIWRHVDPPGRASAAARAQPLGAMTAEASH